MAKEDASKVSGRIRSDGFTRWNALAGASSVTMQSILPCRSAWMASAPLLYRSTLVPPPSFSSSVASPSLVVPSCTPITAPFKSVLLLICLSASDAPEPHATKSTLRSKVKKPSLNFPVFLYFIISGIRFLLFQILSTHLCTSFSVYTSRYDSACITSTFATWEESLDADMLQGFAVTDDADRR